MIVDELETFIEIIQSVLHQSFRHYSNEIFMLHFHPQVDIRQHSDVLTATQNKNPETHFASDFQLQGEVLTFHCNDGSFHCRVSGLGIGRRPGITYDRRD